MKKVMLFATLVVLMTAQILSSAEVRGSKKSDVQKSDVQRSSSIVDVEDGISKSVIPQTIAHQGVIKEDGVAVNGNYNLSFKIYSVSTGGTALWSETHSAVAITGGIFNVILGSVTPIALGFTEQYYIGVTLESEAEFSPRIQLTTSPYAFNSKTADTALALNTDVAVSSINSKQNNVTITGGDNITVDNSGSDIVISTDIFNAPHEGDILLYAANPINKMIWVAPEFAVDGDDLGNHTATSNLKTNGNWISNDGGYLDGIFIDTAGKIALGVETPEARLHVGPSSHFGIIVEHSNENGIQINRAYAGDGIIIKNAGEPSAQISSELNNGIEIEGAKGYGVFIGQADADGLHVKSVGTPSTTVTSEFNNGLEIEGAEEHGVFIGRADNDGIRIGSAGDDGIEISSAAYGLYIVDTSSHGVFVLDADGDGVYANTSKISSEWGFRTDDKAYIGAGVVSAKMFAIGKNTGNQTLEPGDLVVISGGYEKAVLGEDNGNPVINVKKADKAESNSIFGVVEYSVNVKTEVKELDDGKSTINKSFRKASHDNANTGDYLSIVILGPADVKVGDLGQDIVAGEPVKLGTNAGVRRIKSTTINGIEIFENGGIVGKALENSNGKGMVKVFVNCK